MIYNVVAATIPLVVIAVSTVVIVRIVHLTNKP